MPVRVGLSISRRWGHRCCPFRLSAIPERPKKIIKRLENKGLALLDCLEEMELLGLALVIKMDGVITAFGVSIAPIFISLLAPYSTLNSRRVSVSSILAEREKGDILLFPATTINKRYLTADSRRLSQIFCWPFRPESKTHMWGSGL